MDPNYQNAVKPLIPSNELTTSSAIASVIMSLLFVGYLGLVVYLSFILYGMSQFALFFIVLIGSFAFPLVVPAVVLILLSCGAITENIRTVVV